MYITVDKKPSEKRFKLHILPSKQIVVLLSSLFLLISIPIGVHLAQQRQDVRKEAKQSDERQTQFSNDKISSIRKLLRLSEGKKITPEYKKGELIIKFSSNSNEKLNKILKQSQNLEIASPTTINNIQIPSVQKINNRNKIVKIKPVFSNIKEKELRKDKKFDDIVKEIKTKFPKRDKRSPKNIKAPNLSKIYEITLKNDKADIESLCKELDNNSDVEYCTLNYRAQISLVPNDPYYSSQGSWEQNFDDLWGLKIINTEQAWDIETGSPDVTMAVVDTGLDYNHPDIQENVWFNLGEDIDQNEILDENDINGIDDDQNGFIDDFKGWDFANVDNDPLDDHGHGTHVSGTAAAVTNNNTGIAGVSWSSKIMAVKGLDGGGYGYNDELANSLIYAADNGADVINNSWGGFGDSGAEFFQDVINYAHSLGAIIVAAAGNEYQYLTNNHFPGGLEHVVTVAATDMDDVKAHFSNWGELVDVAAPGVYILSLRANGTKMGLLVDDFHTVAQGTSMAAPHVVGLAALTISKYPLDTNEEISARIQGTADYTSSPLYIGSGRINAYEALTALPQPNINIQSHQLDDLAGGNGDNYPDPGETINLILSLRNNWEAATSVEVTLQINDPYITLNKDNISFGDILQDQVVDNTNDPFSFDISNDIPMGHQVDVQLLITASNNYSAHRYLTFTVSPFTMIDEGEIVNERSKTENISWADYNNDGLLDIFLSTWYFDPEENILYQNNGDDTFTRITDAGDLLDHPTFSFNETFGDYDNDGDLDLYQTNYQPPDYPDETPHNSLFLNNGDGTFSIQPNTKIVDEYGYYGTWGDYDNDGYLDIFMMYEHHEYPGSSLYHNNGDGTFTEIADSQLNGLYAFSGSWGDYDNDSYLDIFLGYLGSEENNRLYHNNGDGTFSLVEDSVISNDPTNTVGGSWADFDNDGYLDLFVTNFWFGNNLLYHNNGDGTFTKLIDSEIATVGAYSGSWADFDNDGYLDLFVNNLWILDNNYLFKNNGDGTFTKIVDVVSMNNSTGSAWGDFNNDGFVDLFVSNVGPANYLFKNKGNDNHWININLIGVESNTSAIGARVKLRSTINDQETWQIREVSSKEASGSQSSLNVEFGLGDANTIEEILVEWPSGKTSSLYDVSVDQFITIREDNNDNCFYADFDCDCQVDDQDISIISKHINCLKGQVCYSRLYDITPKDNPDGEINILDFTALGALRGWRLVKYFRP